MDDSNGSRRWLGGRDDSVKEGREANGDPKEEEERKGAKTHLRVLNIEPSN